jgi:hypothetical protein
MARTAAEHGNGNGTEAMAGNVSNPASTATEDGERRLTEDGTAFTANDARAASETNAGMNGGGESNGHRETATGTGTATETGSAPLFAQSDSEGFRSRWSDVQTQFVDEPRSAVEQADSLVAELMKRLAESFAAERGKLEQEWDRGGEVSTEDLRQALRRYRSFFERLLSV